jgi:hypothetical protein
MKVGVLICLLLVGSVTRAGVESGAFEEARRVPRGGPPSFFIFTTSFGKYTIRHDGMGELGVNGTRRPFYLGQKIRLVGRLEQLYFREFEDDVLLLYQVSSGRVYLARMNQTTKRIRWHTPLQGSDAGPCVVEGEEAHCGAPEALTRIDLKTGSPVKSE